MPYIGALIVSLIGAGVCPLFLKYFEEMQCAIPNSTNTASYFSNTDYSESLASHYEPTLIGGPVNRLTDVSLADLATIYSPNHTLFGSRGGDFVTGFQNVSSLKAAITPASSVEDFMDSVVRKNVSLNPGAFWLGDGTSSPYFAWPGDNYEIADSILTQNVINNLLANTSIFVGYANFDIPPEPALYSFLGLLFIIYFALVFCIYPGFFAIYPTRERLQNVRALQYSNGVRSLPTWLAHLAFDTIFVLLISTVATILLGTSTHLWYHVPYLFLILLLYGISSAILGYIISMVAKSHLGALAFLVGGQVAMLMAYFGSYLGVQANTDVADLQLGLNKVQFGLALFSPSANLMRALFISLNQFLIVCGKQLAGRFLWSPSRFGVLPAI